MFKSPAAADSENARAGHRSGGGAPQPQPYARAAGAVSRTATHTVDNGDCDRGAADADAAILRAQRAGRSASSGPKNGWAVPPRVLLVDDDAVYRRLTSRLLQALECTIDVAVDGVGAVSKVTQEKYDLVLMDIVMPKLDGISATITIRQFDSRTPIIATTSNSKPNEVAVYYSRGMQDVLPKPFTKEGLSSVLEKHLAHLKHITRQVAAPSIDVHQLSAQFEQSLVIKSANPSASNKGGVKIKLRRGAGTALSEEEYASSVTVLRGVIDDDDSIKISTTSMNVTPGGLLS